MIEMDAYRDDMMAALEGSLPPEREARLLRHLDGCAASRDEFAWFKAIAADLEELGGRVRESVPGVNLVEGVMESVGRAKEEARTNVVPFRRPERRRAWRSVLPYLATAAAAVLVLWVSGYRITEVREPAPAPTQALAPADSGTGDSEKSEERVAKTEALDESQARFQLARRALPQYLRAFDDERAQVAASGPPDAGTLGIADILELRREAESDPSAYAQLAKLARLNPEDALELARSAEVSAEAKTGMVRALPPDEAEAVLLAAIDTAPDDAYPRYELARTYGADPASASRVEAQLIELGVLDPKNALVCYKLASSLLAQDDHAGACAELKRASLLPRASVYTKSAAVCRSRALEANGLAPGAARLLAALTAGAEQYSDLCALGEELLQHGEYVESLGDLARAEEIYMAVRELGKNLADGADFAHERLAGLDIQRVAIEMLRGVYSRTGDEREIGTLTMQTLDLGKELTAVVGFFRAVGDFLLSPIDENLADLFGVFVLENGDLPLLDHPQSPLYQ